MIESKQLDLHGFSGNKIELIRLEGETFVRKTAKDISFNSKMEKEIIKIKELEKISKIKKNFKVPKIRTIKKNSAGCIVYELEFIPGESLDTCLYNMNSKKIKFFAKKIGEIINDLSSKTVKNKLKEKEFILKKFQELKTELSKKKNLQG